MKRSFQEVVELVVFGLIALLIGTGLLWLVGWVFGLVGLLMKFLAGLIWWLLRYIVPIAIVAGLIYFLVRVLQGDRRDQATPATATPTGTGSRPAPAGTAPSSTAPSSAVPSGAAPTDAAADAGSPPSSADTVDEGS
ncbi:MAG TPA: hypothetical protein VKB31_09810, partial [Trueperaceae bacterium]|nr:hypothetical protein [Trueperaceae bacterium]